jgi:phosphoglycolate phosphatase
MSYKAAIFDLDGTLVDSLEDVANSMNAVLIQMNLEPHRVSKYRFMMGNGLRNLVVRALPPDKQILVDMALGKMREHYSKNALNRTKIYPGIAETLMKLRQRDIKLAVLTNKEHIFAAYIVEHYFGTNMFELIWGTMTSRPIKPDPAGLAKLLNKLNVKPSEAVFVGDRGVDMDVARATGVTSIGVTWSGREEKELLEHHAVIIIDKPEELLEHI